MGFFHMLGAALAGLAKFGLSTAKGCLYWGEQFLKWPFTLLGGGGGAMPLPEYKPDVTSTELLDEFEQARSRQATVRTLDRDDIDTIMTYTRSSPAARATFDFGCVKEDLKNTLLDMNAPELDALGRGGIGAIRKFLAGQDHGTFGVRKFVAGQAVKAAAPELRETMTDQERMFWRVRSRVEKTGPQFKMPR